MLGYVVLSHVNGLTPKRTCVEEHYSTLTDTIDFQRSPLLPELSAGTQLMDFFSLESDGSVKFGEEPSELLYCTL